MEKNIKVPISSILKAFWPGIKPYRLTFFASLSCFIIGIIANIFVPIFYKKFFDILGAASGDRAVSVQALINTLLLVALLHGINWLFYRCGMFIYNYMESGVMARLKQIAFDYMMLHSYSFFSSNFTGSLVQRVNRFSRSFERLCDSLTFNIIPLFITIVGSIIVTWTISPWVAILIFSWVTIFSTFNILFSLWKQKYDVAVAQIDSLATGVLADDITNHNSISLFSGYKDEVKNYRRVTEEQARKTRFSWSLGEVVDMMQVFLIYVVEFAVFYYSVKYWEQGLATIGTFVLFQVYIIGLAQQLWGLNRIVRGIFESIADSREMVQILAQPYEIKDIQSAPKLIVKSGEIKFVDSTFSFKGNKEVLSGLNFVIRPGEKVGLVGMSGSGKTTLVRLILRLYDLTVGAIYIDEQDISRVTQESLRANISLVPQDPILFHRTLMDNIRYGNREATDKDVIKAAELAHCDEFIQQLVLKYDTYVGERGIRLSGGERQRVAIARAILKNAPILILDEATSSLDSHSEILIQDALDNLMHGRTVIVIAHRLSTIRKMDRIIVLDKGQVTEQGSHEELLKQKNGIYQKLWQLQVSGFIKG